MRITLILCLSLLVFTAIADDSLWDKLKLEDNMIVLMRNSESSGNRDGANMLAWDATGRCEGESKLTAKGRDQSKNVGAVFAAKGIKPMVISSPMCRCTETAQIAFGDYITDPDLRQRPITDDAGQEIFMTRTAELLAAHRGKQPIVFVNHRPNIDALSMELINIGEGLVGRITEDGEVELLGKLSLVH